MIILSVKWLTHFSRFAPLKVRYWSQEGKHGTETKIKTSSVRICRRDGVDHPSGHDVGDGCAELANLSDLLASTFAFVLRAPTCASMCSYSVCWVWCSQPRSHW